MVGNYIWAGLQLCAMSEKNEPKSIYASKVPYQYWANTLENTMDNMDISPSTEHFSLTEGSASV